MEATFRLNAVPVAALPGDEPVGLRRATAGAGAVLSAGTLPWAAVSRKQQPPKFAVTPASASPETLYLG
jgi:hypothetical protein